MVSLINVCVGILGGCGGLVDLGEENIEAEGKIVGASEAGAGVGGGESALSGDDGEAVVPWVEILKLGCLHVLWFLMCFFKREWFIRKKGV